MTPANATLVFPADPDVRPLSGKRIPLIFGPPHPARPNSHPILVDPDGETISYEVFRELRVKLRAWIETDDPEFVRQALAVAEDEPGIVLVKLGPCRGMLEA